MFINQDGILNLDPEQGEDNMIIEAVTVCVGYSDFLAQVIPYNISLFDRWVVVTTPSDEDTRELCRRWGIYCLLTDEFFRNGDEFNKARGIIRGIDLLAGKNWVVHIDADMVLPSTFKKAIESGDLDKDCIYGIDRALIKNYREWEDLKRSGYLQHDFHCRVNFPPNLPMGSRWANHAYGYVPIGAFQMWWSETDLYKGIHTKPYPVAGHGDAARNDIQFSLQWDRRHRQLIPEVIGIHLESEPASLGVNWKGRKTKKFEREK